MLVSLAHAKSEVEKGDGEYWEIEWRAVRLVTRALLEVGK